jgi:hypothetical protein
MVLSGTRVTVVTSAVILAAGMLVILASIVRDEPYRAIGGAALTMTSLTLIAMVAIRKWITDTSAERAALRYETQQATNDRMKAIAAQSAMEVERGRIRRDSEHAAKGLATQLAAEREKLFDELEEARNQIIQDATEVALTMFLTNGGIPGPRPTRDRSVIRGAFPEPETAARERVHHLS